MLWMCSAPLVELPATATLEQFHADQKGQEELERLKKENEVLSGKINEIADVIPREISPLSDSSRG